MVRVDGNVEDRATGTVIGRVYLSPAGWTIDTRLDLPIHASGMLAPGVFGTRWIAARTLYDAWVNRNLL